MQFSQLGLLCFFDKKEEWWGKDEWGGEEKRKEGWENSADMHSCAAFAVRLIVSGLLWNAVHLHTLACGLGHSHAKAGKSAVYLVRHES